MTRRKEKRQNCICKQDAISKFRSCMGLKNLLVAPFEDIRVLIKNYISTKERVITAERVKSLSDVQGDEKSDHDFLARIREEARYCDFETLKTVTKSQEQLVKIKFILGFSEFQAGLSGIKTKPTITLSKMAKTQSSEVKQWFL